MSYIPLKRVLDVLNLFKFDKESYVKTSVRPKLEVHDEEIASDEVLAVASGDEVAFNNLKVDGRMIVKGAVDVVGDIEITGTLDIIDDGIVNVGL